MDWHGVWPARASEEVSALVRDVGASSASTRTLAPMGKPGNSAEFRFAERGQWLGFYSATGAFITGTPAGGFSLVSRMSPRQSFVIGTPYPVTGTAPSGQAVRLTQPRTDGK